MPQSAMTLYTLCHKLTPQVKFQQETEGDCKAERKSMEVSEGLLG